MFERSELLKKLIEQLDSSDIHLNVGEKQDGLAMGDEIFHTPSISFCILVLTNLRSFKLKVPETGHFVAVTLQESVTGLSKTQSDLRWSFRLRAVCAEALEFLERNEMVTISIDKTVEITNEGKEFLSKSTSDDPSLELFRRGIIRGFERAKIRGERLV